jgi:hypothetical protein
MPNRVWVIEFKINKEWFPFLECVFDIKTTHYTRAEARSAKRAIETASYYKTSARYRVRKYISV